GTGGGGSAAAGGAVATAAGGIAAGGAVASAAAAGGESWLREVRGRSPMASRCSRTAARAWSKSTKPF
ncbi:MAG: flagellar hook-length control protein FliK, partial [Verrucomicrobiaceae bacterium]